MTTIFQAHHNLAQFKNCGRLCGGLLGGARYSEFYYERAGDKREWAIPEVPHSDYAVILSLEDQLMLRVAEFEQLRWNQGGLRESLHGQSGLEVVGESPALNVRLSMQERVCFVRLQDPQTHDFIQFTMLDSEFPFCVSEELEKVYVVMILDCDCTIESGQRLFDHAASSWPEKFETVPTTSEEQTKSEDGKETS